MNQTESIVAPVTATPKATRSATGQTWRLTKWYLFATRRRLMTKILVGLLIGFFLVFVAFNILNYALIASQANSSPIQCPSTIVSTPGNQQQNGQPSCQDLQQQQQQEAASLKAVADEQRQSLTFPMALSLGGGFLGSMGIILFCIMTAGLAGGEYSTGTLRLTLSRGTQRGQVIAAQIMALAILSLIVSAFILVLMAIIGAIVGPIIGGTIPAFSLGAGVELLAYWLVNALAIFAFALIALLMSTLSRNVIAGIAVALGYLIFESIAGNVLYFAGVSLNSSFGNFLSHIPDYLIGYNTGALTHLAAKAPIALYPVVPQFSASSGSSGNPTPLLGPGGSIDVLHALLVIAVYCALFGGLSYLFLRRRDVTE
jgi:ABC-type transport system involved in multi-copper enzyme maturation permease subunit